MNGKYLFSSALMKDTSLSYLNQRLLNGSTVKSLELVSGEIAPSGM